MIFNFIFGRPKKERNRQGSALADLRVGESAILSDLELAPPVAEHLMNLGFVPGLEVHGCYAALPAAILACTASKEPKLPCAAMSPVTFTWS